MLVSKKVGTFQEPVAGKNLVEPRRAFEERGVVADSQAHSGDAGSPRRGDFFDPLENASLPHSWVLGE
jgi:hypothetical protein